LPDQVVRGPLPLMFISRNPQSVALHGGHLVRACPDFQEKYDEQFRPSFRGRAIFPDRIELNREKPAALKSGLGEQELKCIAKICCALICLAKSYCWASAN
jgi:hypothetical protein